MDIYVHTAQMDIYVHTVHAHTNTYTHIQYMYIGYEASQKNCFLLTKFLTVILKYGLCCIY